MTIERESRRDKATLEQVRTDAAALYDETYYSHGYATDTDEAYGRHGHWLTFFDKVAHRIKKRIGPKTVLDVGCAFGLLVEALNDRGVNAWGIDISPYAVAQAREDMRDRITEGSLLDPLPLQNQDRYDLVVCIEVLEHLPPESAELAVKRLCDASDRILFSSSPDDFEEPTHFNVLPTSEWVKLFEANGYHLANDIDATFIAAHAFVVQHDNAKRIKPRFLRWL